MPNNQYSVWDWNAQWYQVPGVEGQGQPNFVDYALQAQLLASQQIVVFAGDQLTASKPKAVPVDEEGEMLNKFMVGCDPEFVIQDATGAMIQPHLYFPHTGPIGYDHGGRVAEFRPEPRRGVLMIIRQLQDLVKQTRTKVPVGKLKAGAIFKHDCLGGHIHFGFDAFEQKPTPGFSILNGGGKFNEKGATTTKALDVLTKALEHLDILPANECAKRRASSQGQGNYYGAYGDVRDCNGHMEYRTMASWLYDPKVAFLTMTAAKLAACDPKETAAILATCDSFDDLKNWLERYKTKDVNATRASEKLLDKGLKNLQVDPTVDFGERWESLGL